mmetsp:Transcript_6721/g.25210  ORF Transcript_6721/g.25210 Transcript_6721/m.25210 type:complete len:254 (+) Transcript_6721:1161-1922(+)
MVRKYLVGKLDLLENCDDSWEVVLVITKPLRIVQSVPAVMRAKHALADSWSRCFLPGSLGSAFRAPSSDNSPSSTSTFRSSRCREITTNDTIRQVSPCWLIIKFILPCWISSIKSKSSAVLANCPLSFLALVRAITPNKVRHSIGNIGSRASNVVNGEEISLVGSSNILALGSLRHAWNAFPYSYTTWRTTRWICKTLPRPSVLIRINSLPETAVNSPTCTQWSHNAISQKRVPSATSSAGEELLNTGLALSC